MIEWLNDLVNLDISCFQICVFAGITTTLNSLSQRGGGRFAQRWLKQELI